METITRAYKFNSHKVHNPACDILEFQIDKDTHITFGIYVKDYMGDKCYYQNGKEFMEVYTGSNYNVSSIKRSYSRVYYFTSDMPNKYKDIWFEMRYHYHTNLKNL